MIEPPFERYEPHPAEFDALVAAVVAGEAPEAVRLPPSDLGEDGELATRIKDLLYRIIKTYLDQVPTGAGRPPAADDPVLRILEKGFARSSGLLRGCETENDMLATLVSRIGHLPELAALTQALSRTLTPPYLALRHPPPDLSNPAPRHTLSGHSDLVDGCAITADGGTIVSASWDGTLKVWDAASGDELMTLAGHSGIVFDCAISEDGVAVVSASGDKTLKIWDARTGAELMTLAGHTDDVDGCAMSADGSTVIATTVNHGLIVDSALKVWDLETETKQLTLTGHEW